MSRYMNNTPTTDPTTKPSPEAAAATTLQADPGYIDPDKRAALIWACSDRTDPPPNAHASAAFAFVQVPEFVAAITRRLLERLGVVVVEHGTNYGTPGFPYVSISDGHIGPLYVSFDMSRAKAVIGGLATLKSGDRDGAVRVLKGVS